VPLTAMDEDLSRIWASFKLFAELSCLCRGREEEDHNNCEEALELVDEDMMRCHIINCLTALLIVQIHRTKKQMDKNVEAVKRKVFTGAVLMILNSESESDQSVVNTILSAFPEEKKKHNGMIWLPIHFAIALTGDDKISNDDFHTLLSMDPLAMHRMSKSETDKEDEDQDEDDEDQDKYLTGCTPVHILCMPKQPKMSLVRYFCVRNPKAFLLCDQSGRCALHLVAQYSESVELLQCILQMDSTMTKRHFDESGTGEETTPLGLLCRRLEFPTFDKMVSCLIEVDSTVEVIADSIGDRLRSFDECLHQDVAPGSRGERSVILLGNPLDANPSVTKYANSNIFHEACMFLRGELGVSVLTLLLLKDDSQIKVVTLGSLPIHTAASCSCLDVVKFLHKAHPESISTLDEYGRSLLFHALIDEDSNFDDAKLKLQYLCNQCPALIYLKDANGIPPLHFALAGKERTNFGCVRILCDIDETIVREKLTHTHTLLKGRLPLYTFLYFSSQILEVSDEGDCFRFLLRLYPAAAGINDARSKTAYDTAVKKNMSVYFIRLLLAADPALDPVKRRDLNFEARRQGMFLAFSALSSSVKLIIWARIRFENKNLLQHVISYL
jgi:hypothetical protein